MTPQLFDIGKDQSSVLAALHAGSFAEAWSAAALIALLATPGSFAFYLPDGFVLLRAAGDEAEILTLAVSPAARGRGLGRMLLKAAAVHAAGLGVTSLFLEVGTENPAALALYAGLGFVKAGQRKGYYAAGSGMGTDALILKAQLPLSPPGDFA